MFRFVAVLVFVLLLPASAPDAVVGPVPIQLSPSSWWVPAESDGDFPVIVNCRDSVCWMRAF